MDDTNFVDYTLYNKQARISINYINVEQFSINI